MLAVRHQANFGLLVENCCGTTQPWEDFTPDLAELVHVESGFRVENGAFQVSDAVVCGVAPLPSWFSG